MGPPMSKNQVKKSQSHVASPHPLRGGGGGGGGGIGRYNPSSKRYVLCNIFASRITHWCKF